MKIRIRLSLATVILGLTVASLAWGMISVGSKIPKFAVEDQHEKLWRNSDFTNKPVLYIVCDQSAYEHTENWTDRLVAKYKGKIHFVPVADVSSAPGFLKGYIRGRFKDEFTYPILMDWDAVLVKGLEMVDGYPTLVLADKNGAVKYRSYGKGTKAQVDRIIAKIDEALAQ